MLYLFVLGRDYELSKLEIESLFEARNMKFRILDESKEAVVLDAEELNPKIIDEFGGIIKIAKVISNTSDINEIEDNLDKADLYNGNSNKIEYYIDAFSTNLLSFVEDYLKDYFRSIKLKALYRGNADPSKLINKDILKKGIELVIFKNYIGKTTAITNPKEFKTRDLARPKVDYMKVISIRLAKILINISKAKENETLLDPFCGSGTVLQEALLKGINVIGIDDEKEAVEMSEENIKWLINSYNIKKSYKIIRYDCRELNKVVKKESVDAAVTEPYMGPFIRKLPTIEEAKKLISELSNLYDELLINLKYALKKSKRLVIIIPKFRTMQNRVVFLDFRSIAEKNGFLVVNNPINYGYKESKLLRDIYVLERE